MALSGSKSLKWHSFDSTMVPFEAFVDRAMPMVFVVKLSTYLKVLLY